MSSGSVIASSTFNAQYITHADQSLVTCSSSPFLRPPVNTFTIHRNQNRDFDINRNNFKNRRRSLSSAILHSENDDEQMFHKSSSLKNHDRVVFNVSGTIFETFESTLQEFPDTLLARQERRSHFYIAETGEFCFQRNRNAFESILYFYQSKGRFIIPESVTEQVMREEIEFFGLDTHIVSLEGEVEEDNTRASDESIKPRHHKDTHTLWLHHLLELPNLTIAGTLVGYWISFIVGINVVFMCAETMPYFQSQNSNSLSKHSTFRNLNMTKITSHGNETTGKELRVLMNMETACATWFAFEYFLRVLSSPRKIFYVRSCLGIFDLLSFAPHFISLCIEAYGMESEARLHLLPLCKFLRFFSMVKWSRYCAGLRVVWFTLLESSDQILLLSVCITITLVLFGSVIYYSEYEVNKQFTSIPASFWYCVVTMGTVGYGDMSPLTFMGRFFGSMCALFGVCVVLALPTTVFVSNFTHIYDRVRQDRKVRVLECARRCLSSKRRGFRVRERTVDFTKSDFHN